jgi:short-subunit dehydrogenase
MNCIITGATKGIGKATTELLASHGGQLYVCARKEKDLENLQKELEKRFPACKIFYAAVDLSRKAEVYAFARAVLAEWTHIDALINNAGYFTPSEMLEESDEQMEELMKINFFAPFYLTKALVPQMLQQGAGHIINICSIASQRAYPQSGSYSTTKFALYGFTKALREDLKGKNIKVTAVLPGPTWTNSWAGVDLPKDRLMRPEAVAQSIYHAMTLPGSAVMEEIVLRPQLGDLD